MSTGEERLFVLAPDLLEACTARHTRLCPRQVLGLRMGLFGAKTLGLDVPCPDKRLLVIAETDGCMADGLITVTGCSVGRRTLRIIDYGKVAATFVDVETGRAVRVFPREGSRKAARVYSPQAKSRWHAQLDGYKVMPDDALLAVQEVMLTFSLEALIGTEGYRVTCDACGEEIINQREVRVGERVLCRPCAGQTYYALPASARLPLGKLTVITNPILGDL